MNHPLLLLALTAAGIYLGKLWRDDCQASKSGRPNPNGLPGATHAPFTFSAAVRAGAAAGAPARAVAGLSARAAGAAGVAASAERGCAAVWGMRTAPGSKASHGSGEMGIDQSRTCSVEILRVCEDVESLAFGIEPRRGAR